MFRASCALRFWGSEPLARNENKASSVTRGRLVWFQSGLCASLFQMRKGAPSSARACLRSNSSSPVARNAGSRCEQGQRESYPRAPSGVRACHAAVARCSRCEKGPAPRSCQARGPSQSRGCRGELWARWAISECRFPRLGANGHKCGGK